MKNHIKTISILCVTTVIFSCKKEKPPISIPGLGCSSANCPEMYEKRTSEYPDTLHFTDTQPGCVVMWDAVYQQTWVYGSFSTNPKNNYEFVTVRTNPNQPQQGGELCIYNFCNNQVEIIANNAVGSTSWSKNDRILYIGSDLNLYSIKSDGSEKLNFTNGGINTHPKWSPDGTKFIYKNIADNPNRLRICDENGEITG